MENLRVDDSPTSRFSKQAASSAPLCREPAGEGHPDPRVLVADGLRGRRAENMRIEGSQTSRFSWRGASYLPLCREPADRGFPNQQVFGRGSPWWNRQPITCGRERQNPSGSCKRVALETLPDENLLVPGHQNRRFSGTRTSGVPLRREPAGRDDRRPRVLGAEDPQRRSRRKTCGHLEPKPAGSLCRRSPKARLAENLRGSAAQIRRFSGTNVSRGRLGREPAGG